jgi:para-nitrobenzyl esterase
MPVVHTKQGDVRGSVEAGGVLRFAGIPYAQPPVGELRWAPPQPVGPWEGVHDATRFGNTAIQTIDTKMIDFRSEVSEDCLYLNVWTTTTDPDAKQPVMFWIHGGGFLNGTSSGDKYDGEALAAQGVTVVSVNYRLGAFGFFNHPETGTNFALLDWIAGLEWVRDNVESFGGDPERVLIFGQSAGGAAVRALLHAPKAHGLFSRAVIMSAGYEPYAHVETPDFARTEQASRGVLETLGASTIAEARRASAEEVRLASLQNSGLRPPEGQLHTPANLVWYPIVDGATMVDEFAGWADGVPVMIGVTADEARLFMQPDAIYARPDLRPEDAYTPEVLGHMARRLAGPQADAVVESYERRGLTPYEGIAELTSEAVWFEPCLASADRLSRLGRAPIYPYIFARVSPGNRASGMLAYHSAEVDYVFGHVDEGDLYDADDLTVRAAAQGGWVSFARDGVPSRPDGTAWEPFSAENPTRERIDVASGTEPYSLGEVGEMLASLRA